MNIRQATESDAADIARIHVDTWRVAYAGIVPESHLSNLSVNDCKQKWAKTLSKSANGTRVAVMPDGQTVGWTSFGPSRDSDRQGICELYAIYLDNSHWGQGIGRKLMEDAVSLLRDNGFTTITLWVLQENMRARAFYEKFGFGHDGTAKAINIDGKKLIEIRCRKPAQQDARVDALTRATQL